MKNYNTYLFCLMLLFGSLKATYAQTDSTVTDSTEASIKRNTFRALPIAFFLPETRWGFGAAGIFKFKFKSAEDSANPSQVSFGGAYTLNRQILSYATFRIYSGNAKNLFFGEVGYYKYIFNYYGIGPYIDKNYAESYDLVFPRVRFNAQRQINPHFSVGPSLFFDDFTITKTEAAGLLESPTTPGYKGGRILGVGAGFNFDTRDGLFWPTKGFFIDGRVLSFPSGISEYAFTQFYINASFYKKLLWNDVFAINMIYEGNYGDVPFFGMAQLGGTKVARGFYQGRFRDHQLTVLNFEYRSPYLWRFAFVGIGNYGGVSPSIGKMSFNQMYFNYGAGLRFCIDEKDLINVRIDAVKSFDGVATYITLTEAF